LVCEALAEALTKDPQELAKSKELDPS
jgi:hypothetical protein